MVQKSFVTSGVFPQKEKHAKAANWKKKKRSGSEGDGVGETP